MKTLRIILAAMLLAAPALDAQLVADGATNTLSNVTTNITGNVTVGTNGSFTLLVLSDNAVLTNSVNGIIGLNAAAQSNEVRLLSSTARWFMGADLIVGNNGRYNRLVVENGGQVTNLNGYVGFGFAAKTNIAYVTGANSVWNSQSNLTVGVYSSGNHLIVSNGATVSADSGVIGLNTGANSNSVSLTDPGSSWLLSTYVVVGSNSAANRLVISNGAQVVISDNFNGLVGYRRDASNNMMMVTGPGSLWRNDRGQVLVGAESPGNQLVVSNGAVVQDLHGEIGGFDLSASNNTVIVTGAGSLWSNAGILTVGVVGQGNQLLISNGGTVSVSNLVLVGDGAASANNSLVVNGGTLRATNASGRSMLDVRRGTVVLNSGLIDVDQLVLTNATQSFFELNGGTLITRGALVTNGTSFIVGDAGTTPAVWDVRAGGSNYLSHGLIVGNDSSFNRLLVTNGAQLNFSLILNVGLEYRAQSNSVVISGPGSRLETDDGVQAGVFGSFNQMVISNGGSVQGNLLFVGNIGSNNTAVVTDPGSVLAMGTAEVGDSGAGNRLVVSNGAAYSGSFLLIGNENGAKANEVLVTGVGSYLTNTGELWIGNRGSANRLTVSDGATVLSSNVYVGFLATSTNNRVVVDGGALLLTNNSVFSSSFIRRLDIRSGTNVLNAGVIAVPLLLVTNAAGQFEFNGGLLKCAGTSYGNGRVFNVGNGVSAATFQLLSGTHGFTNGMAIANNATLTGTGTIMGTMAVSSGGTLSPGDGIGTLIFSNSPSLGGTIVMEAFKLGATKLNDQVQVAGTLFYGGSLIVSNVGTAFNAGDNFKLFNATVFGGTFSSLTLPPLNAGLGWMNKLLVDGSIEVVSMPQPGFSSITVSGTNVVISGTNGSAGANYTVLTATNVALSLSNWVSLVTNQFDSSGNFSFTNPIAPGERQRFFRIRTP
jgi:fibronectin-binding autotransporter adhesin